MRTPLRLAMHLTEHLATTKFSDPEWTARVP
ncbi:hypothetical protein QFZ63_006861 [Streptomyces sp. B3I7]|nr:hypothetical protein [Streptomyces sp. B3I8]MDQ0815147.1 hypothetical protein [Streptomyces sp. B3I7]